MDIVTIIVVFGGVLVMTRRSKQLYERLTSLEEKVDMVFTHGCMSISNRNGKSG